MPRRRSEAAIFVFKQMLYCLLLFELATFASLAIAQVVSAPNSRPPRPLKEQVGFPNELYRSMIPPDNPQTSLKVALGRQLFFDKRLSENNTQMCASCHNPDKGFTDQLPTAIGIHAKSGQRNTLTVLNAAFNVSQFWDGREQTLEGQVKDPIVNPGEMGMKNANEVVTKIASVPEYQRRFWAAFGEPVTMVNIQRAIAAYERIRVTFNTPFDRFVAGDLSALTPQQQRGWAIFNGKGRCMSCHEWKPTRPFFTDNHFHNIGVSICNKQFVSKAQQVLALLGRDSAEPQEIDRLAIANDMSELGRFLVTKQYRDIGAFRTPDLRNLLVTEPYFHDGSQKTLWDVVDLFNKGGMRNPFLDSGVVPLGLTEPEIDELVAFLASLTSPEYAKAAQIEYQKQFRLSRTFRPQRNTAVAIRLKEDKGARIGSPTSSNRMIPNSAR